MAHSDARYFEVDPHVLIINMINNDKEHIIELLAESDAGLVHTFNNSHGIDSLQYPNIIKHNNDNDKAMAFLDYILERNNTEGRWAFYKMLCGLDREFEIHNLPMNRAPESSSSSSISQWSNSTDSSIRNENLTATDVMTDDERDKLWKRLDEYRSQLAKLRKAYQEINRKIHLLEKKEKDLMVMLENVYSEGKSSDEKTPVHQEKYLDTEDELLHANENIRSLNEEVTTLNEKVEVLERKVEILEQKLRDSKRSKICVVL